MSNLPLLTPCRTPSTKPVKELTYKDTKNINIKYTVTTTILHQIAIVRCSLITGSIQHEEENDKAND